MVNSRKLPFAGKVVYSGQGRRYQREKSAMSFIDVALITYEYSLWLINDLPIQVWVRDSASSDFYFD